MVSPMLLILIGLVGLIFLMMLSSSMAQGVKGLTSGVAALADWLAASKKRQADKKAAVYDNAYKNALAEIEEIERKRKQAKL